MIYINDQISLADWEVQITATTSQGPGGQNVNKVATAIQLKFDIPNSSIHPLFKSRLLRVNDQRLSRMGVLSIKAQNHRTQEKNKEEAISRLREFCLGGLQVQKRRTPTRPTYNSQVKRIVSKQKRGEVKSMRRKPRIDD